MRGLDTRHLRSRVKGRVALEKSLHALHRRAYRLASCRDLSGADYRWVLDVATALQQLLAPAAADAYPTIEARLNIVDGRRGTP